MMVGEKRGVFATAARAALLAGTLVTFASTGASAQCVGDCNDNEIVAINELILAVNIFLDNAELSACSNVDANGDGTVAINELVQAVNNSLLGCDPRPQPTATPTPVVRTASCVLSDESSLVLLTAVFPIPLDEVAGELAIECTEPSGVTSGLSGDLACTCSVTSFEPIVISGIGDVCIAPFEPCEPRVLSCDGGAAVDVNLTSDRNIGECTGGANCASMCESYCGDLGSGFGVQASTCEHFCVGGERDDEACTLDEQCPGGACGGPEGGTDGNICECVCAEPATGSDAGAGAFSCALGVAITVETDSGVECGSAPPSITLEPVCGELTSGTSIGQLLNAANNVPAVTLGPSTLTGAPTSCTDLAAGSVSGLNLVGHLAFFGSAVGDILVDNNFVCE